MSEGLNPAVHRRAAELLAKGPEPEAMLEALQLLARWRAHLIGAAILKRDGAEIQSGPFKGMRYIAGAAEGSFSSRLLGGYEASLHPIIEEIVARAYPSVVDIGCAEGYYSVGLAMRMQAARIFAYDIEADARRRCAALAEANGVAAQVEIRGAFERDGLAGIPGPVLVICDAEGAEETLLDPAAPGFAAADVLVEAHDVFRPGTAARLTARFEATHEVTQIGRALAPEVLPDWAEAWSDLDRALALWEWRGGPTPWLWMQARRREG